MHRTNETLTLLRILLVALIACAAWACSPKYPKCDSQEDCRENEFCVNGMCQQCRDDSDCSRGQQCNAGRCEAIQGYCEGSDDCGENEECVNNRCVASVEEELDVKDDTVVEQCSIKSKNVFFAFDSNALDGEARSQLQAIARCIQERKVDKVHVTGHCDPRGTEEYNLALGDRRAQSVRAYLQSLGVKQDKLSSSSMGEEMASMEESEWPKNRRVEFTTR